VASGIPDNLPPARKQAHGKRAQVDAFAATNLLLSELYHNNIRSDDELFSAAHLTHFSADRKEGPTTALLVSDLYRIWRIQAKLGRKTRKILGRIAPNTISLYLEESRSDGLRHAARAATAFGDVVGLDPKGKFGTPNSAAIFQALRAMPITDGDILFFSAKHDLWPLMGLLMCAPSGEFVTSPTIGMRAFGEAGFTAYGHNSLELGDDPGAKVHIMHYTLYQKAIVKDPRLVEHRNSTIVHGYEGGWENNSVWDPLDANDRSEWARGNYKHKSYFVIPTYPKERGVDEERIFDMLGSFNPELMRSSGPRCPLMGEHVGRFWGIYHGANPLNRMPFRLEREQYSTTSFEQHTLVPKYKGENNIDPAGEVVLDAGHFGGDWGYPGSSKICTGEQMFIQRPNFSPVSMNPVVAGTGPRL
jgi:hypothetical protein